MNQDKQRIAELEEALSASLERERQALGLARRVNETLRECLERERVLCQALRISVAELLRAR